MANLWQTVACKGKMNQPPIGSSSPPHCGPAWCRSWCPTWRGWLAGWPSCRRKAPWRIRSGPATGWSHWQTCGRDKRGAFTPLAWLNCNESSWNTLFFTSKPGAVTDLFLAGDLPMSSCSVVSRELRPLFWGSWWIILINTHRRTQTFSYILSVVIFTLPLC